MIEVYENRPFRIAEADRRFLSQLLKGRMERRGSAWAITHVVGHVNLPSGETLRIRSPKSSNASVLAWAAYVDPSLAELRFLGTIEELAAEGDLAGLIARLFVQGTLKAARRCGLVRRYERVLTSTSSVRGKIEFVRLARRGGALSRVPCTVWERLPETPLNRLLAAALRRVGQDPAMRAAAGHDLGPASRLFANVRPMVEPDLLNGKTSLERNEKPYTVSCTLARLIVRHCGLAEGGEHLGTSFLINLDSLFEKAVVTAFRNADLEVHSKASLPYERSYPRTRRKTERGSFEVDLLVKDLPDGPLVIDAKYKKAVASDNLHQMISYCFLSGARRAVLVFPKGQLRSRRTYSVKSGFGVGRTPESLRVDLAELDTSAKNVAGWRRQGQLLVESVLAECTENPSPEGERERSKPT